ncbi:Low-affinity inorganic phosphate transporter 1 [Candidatus Profftia lariciata]|uniref:inorganic phosphate transporter n=1 Tax=Candidatus Profftia lariciata TaxID=1987921 RepID=UPI001D030C96|nr:inorganic phosphate transporter [Candidatus Profftia lariciata]UDG81779.1 Low-affinity inorganic phosphate transporter 1 [Candidatus Profftia lariciata]
MLHWLIGIDFITSIMLISALIFVLIYETINGFHDTANAVAIVIYTRSLRLKVAVILSGFFNFLGVIFGGLSVAYAMVHLLPMNLLLNIGSNHGLAMMFALLLAAIIWNLSTWYYGLPASSSHTIIGSIIGIVLSNAMMTNTSIVEALNIPKIIKILLSLILSPIIGLVLAGIMILFLRYYGSTTKKRRRIHMTPAEREKIDGKRKPPFWTRIALSLSAIGVSFSHGANDGQKGIGLLMLVLIGIAPDGFVVNMDANKYEIIRTYDALVHLEQYYQTHKEYVSKIVGIKGYQLKTPMIDHNDLSGGLLAIYHSQSILHNLQNYHDLSLDQRNKIRCLLMCITDAIDQVAKMCDNNSQDKHFLQNLRKDLLQTIEYAPISIIFAIALALSLGTTIGWRRVSITIVEKIGKKNITYAQGIATQITTALSIGIASYTGMPVSTTLVLSSAMAGTMLVDGVGIHSKTIKSILLIWFISLPVVMTLSSILYWLILSFIV